MQVLDLHLKLQGFTLGIFVECSNSNLVINVNVAVLECSVKNLQVVSAL